MTPTGIGPTGDSAPAIAWPDGKRFAFTVFDDTDHTTLDNGPRMYRFLHELGMRTTKSVWPIRGSQRPLVGGTTCADADYRDWVLELQRDGFEIAFHNATYHTSVRADALRGLEEFRRIFGAYPRLHANHADCRDAIYWGEARLTGLHRLVYRALTRGRARGRDGGTDPRSPFFWGDACQAHVDYVRNFVYSDINTLKRCPPMPYHDPDRPFVNRWFAASEGPDRRSFCRTIAEANQERLEAEGGACIMYAHLGSPDFYLGDRLHPEFVRLMSALAERGGWFVPVSQLLDHLRAQRGNVTISPAARARLERRWLFEKVWVTRGTS